MIQYTKSTSPTITTRAVSNTKMSSTKTSSNAWVTRGDFTTKVKNPRSEYSAIGSVSYTYSNEVSSDYVTISVQESVSGEVIVYVATHDYTYDRMAKALVDEGYPVPSGSDRAYCMYTVRSDKISGNGGDGYTNMWSMLEIINNEIYSSASIPYHVLCSVAKNVDVNPPIAKVPSLLIMCAMRVAGDAKMFKMMAEEYVLEERFRDDLYLLHRREMKDAKEMRKYVGNCMCSFGKAWVPRTL